MYYLIVSNRYLGQSKDSSMYNGGTERLSITFYEFQNYLVSFTYIPVPLSIVAFYIIRRVNIRNV